MAKVGKKSFKYTKQGLKKAKAHAKKTGQKVTYAKKRKGKKGKGRAR